MIPDMGSIAAAIGGLKTAADITKGFLDLKEAGAMQGRVIELQGVILSAQSSALAAQSEQLTLLDDIRGLKQKMAELEAWAAEKNRYQLKEFGGGTFAYELKSSEAQGEPAHLACPNCFAKGQKSILQGQGGDAWHRNLYKCHACDGGFALGEKQERNFSAHARTEYDPFSRKR